MTTHSIHFSMKKILAYIICILSLVLIAGLLRNYSSNLDQLGTRNTESGLVSFSAPPPAPVRVGGEFGNDVGGGGGSVKETKPGYDSYRTNICGLTGRRQNAHHHDQVTYILTAEFTGQQGAGIRALVSQQCFSQHLGIPVSIVEPFLVQSILGHMRPSPNQTNLLKFSDMYNIDNFNAISARSGYGPLATWEDFLSNAKEKTILVELMAGEKMMTNTIWETDTTSTTSCYKGEIFSARKELATCTVCIVRVVAICCIHMQIEPANKPELTMKELKNALFGKWKPEEVNLLFTYWSAYWQVPSASCKDFQPVGNVFSSDQLLKQTIEYENLYMKVDQSSVAFVLRFEYLLIENYDVDKCMHNFYETGHSWKSSNRSIFVAADIGKYRSNCWEESFSNHGFNSKKASQFLETLKNAVTLLISDQWTFEEWENSFAKVTAGIEDSGYIASLQKTIASQADCIVFLMRGGNFQALVIEEYVKHHPLQSEQCIHYICDLNLKLQRPA